MDGSSECAFCLIRDGHRAAEFVYRDDATFAIMDGRQPGWPDVAHVIVMPNDHVEVIDDLAAEQAAQVMQTVVRVARAIRRAFQPAGLSLWQSNDRAGGQEVPHVHVHILTRKNDDGLLRIYPEPPPRPSLEAVAPAASAIRAEIDTR